LKGNGAIIDAAQADSATRIGRKCRLSDRYTVHQQGNQRTLSDHLQVVDDIGSTMDSAIRCEWDDAMTDIIDDSREDKCPFPSMPKK
jgi:hypothetical protein